MEEAELRTLRAKYLDWCSARVAERFLELTPEEIYELARPETGQRAGELGPGADRPPTPSGPTTSQDTYTALVQRVTESLLSRVPLPTFDAWRVEYARAPERYDAEMLGFWKDASGGGSTGSSGP